jgi:hypothetical protein
MYTRITDVLEHWEVDWLESTVGQSCWYQGVVQKYRLLLADDGTNKLSAKELIVVEYNLLIIKTISSFIDSFMYNYLPLYLLSLSYSKTTSYLPPSIIV